MLEVEGRFLADLNARRVGIIRAAAHGVGIRIGLAFFAGQLDLELKELALVAQVTSDRLGHVERARRIRICERIRLCAIRFRMYGGDAEIARLVVDHGHDQANQLAIVRNACGLSRHFLQGVFIYAHIGVRGQRNGNLALRAVFRRSARLERRARDRSQSRGCRRFAAFHYAVAHLL